MLHHDVEDDKVRRELLDGAERLARAVDRRDREPRVLQEQRVEFDEVDIVNHDEDVFPCQLFLLRLVVRHLLQDLNEH